MQGTKYPDKFANQSLPLYLEKVCFAWPSGIKALDSCSFSIPRSGLWMIVGSNGSGKSTLFRLIKGMLQPDAGRIDCRLKPSLVFQNPNHQLLLPTCRSDLFLSLPRGLSPSQRQNRIREVLKQVDLEDIEARPIHTLSGGQKQRLALAGALVSDANLLLLDEPTALLDPASQKSILSIVRRLCSDGSNPLTALWITHRLEELKYCDGAARMEEGKVGPWLSGDLLMQGLRALAGRRV